MSTDSKKALAEVKARWDYADVVALVTANLPGTTFSGDRSKWLRAICRLTDEYPEFFKGVRFRRRDPFTPYSREIDEVLKMLGRWEYRGEFNPRFRRIEMDEEGKSQLRNEIGPKLQEHESKISEMAKVLGEFVALRSPSDEDAKPEKA